MNELIKFKNKKRAKIWGFRTCEKNAFFLFLSVYIKKEDYAHALSSSLNKTK